VAEAVDDAVTVDVLSVATRGYWRSWIRIRVSVVAVRGARRAVAVFVVRAAV
jgi:hypothetical protein